MSCKRSLSFLSSLNSRLVQQNSKKDEKTRKIEKKLLNDLLSLNYGIPVASSH